ncbi:uncharacterized protein IL334_005993 [Kwoniella shivajii]|uniref:Uncharacterized protein n=1 Tax=Kwoniella shivajii TaxID=564305 RepID=A0ABZ1D4P5_9TREE|nr:hypothetical protein IL334_005993 [Kwoniella shivajii]
MSSNPPNYSTSSSPSPKHPDSTPPPSSANHRPASSPGDNGLKFQLNIQSLSLDCSIPPGSNIGIQLGIPGTTSTGNPPQTQSTCSNHVPSTSTSQAQNMSSNPANLDPLMWGIAQGYIQKLDSLEKSLSEERISNVKLKEEVERLNDRVNSLQGRKNYEDKIPRDNHHTEDHDGGGCHQDQKSSLNQRHPNIFDKEMDVPRTLSERESHTHTSSTSVPPLPPKPQHEIKPDDIDENESWDDPSGLGLDDDLAVLYGFTPKT